MTTLLQRLIIFFVLTLLKIGKLSQLNYVLTCTAWYKLRVSNKMRAHSTRSDQLLFLNKLINYNSDFLSKYYKKKSVEKNCC